MARPQTFESDVVLAKTMQVFWKNGYANTSVKDLTLATDLQPGSLYGAFKNKRQLFIDSLDCYFEHLYSVVCSILNSSKDPKNRIHDFFDYLTNTVSKDVDNKSCMLVNTLLEIPPSDREINHRVTAMFRKIEKEFVKVLEQAKQQGGLSKKAEPVNMAKTLMSGIFGLQVYNRMQTNPESLEHIVNNLLSILENNEKA